MKILFVCSGGGTCRSMIAKTILRSFDDGLELFSAETGPLSELNPLAVEAMAAYGYKLEPTGHGIISDFREIEFDYVITLCEGTKEEFEKLALKYKKKLHLGFPDPHKLAGHDELGAYRKFVEEVVTELDYFYHHILSATK